MTVPNSTDIRHKTLEAIHDNAVDAIITIDEMGMIQTINRATEKQFGYAPDELVGNNINMLMPGPYRDEHDGYLQNYRDSGIAKIIGIGREVIAKRKDGSVFPVHLAVSEVCVGDQRVFAGFLRDLSELKRVEDQRAILGGIIEESLNEVYIIEVDSLKFVLVNRGARKNLGYEMDELRELRPFDIKPEFTEESFRAMLPPLLEGREEQLDFSTRHQRKDQSQYDVDVRLQLSEFENRPVFVAIILDVTKRRSAERLIQQQQQAMQEELKRLVEIRTQELKRAQAELVRVERLSTLGKVSGGIAHEIRNPLNAVKTSAYYLLNANQPTPEKIREHLERIDRQVSMIDNVVTALSDVAKLPEALLVPVDMERLLRSLVRSVDLPSNISVSYNFAEPLPKVLVDESQIAIAFRNLVRNARDAMPDGGTISISGQPRDARVVFAIEDTGVGIQSEHLDSIMEPLFTTKARGMGLGLSITRAIVEKNRGELTVESQPGVGSQFCIVLNREE